MSDIILKIKFQFSIGFDNNQAKKDDFITFLERN